MEYLLGGLVGLAVAVIFCELNGLRRREVMIRKLDQAWRDKGHKYKDALSGQLEEAERKWRGEVDRLKSEHSSDKVMWAHERDAFHDRAERESCARDLERAKLLNDARDERKELYTRIQLYEHDPKDPTEVVPDKSQSGAKQVDTGSTPGIYTSEDLRRMKLVENSDGGVIDTRNNVLYESVDDWREVQADNRKRGLPENVNPTTLEEHGIEAALEESEANRRASEEVMKAIEKRINRGQPKAATAALAAGVEDGKNS